ncbi:MAG: hypothetical protein AMXMBFR52_12630 [Burkholderiales bacterium]
MAIILEAVAVNGAVQRVQLGSGATTVPAQPGLQYRLLNDAGGRVSQAALVKRVDADLVIEGLPGDQSLSLQGFFSQCTPQASCSMSMENIGGEAGEAITPATAPVATLPEGGFLMYASGMTAGSVAPSHETEFSFKPLLGVAGGIAILGAAGGGGGGSGNKGGSSDTTPPDAPTITSGAYTNQPKPVFTGTAEAGATLTLTLDVGRDGTDVTYSTRVAADGTWTIDTATATPTVGSLPSIAEGVTTSVTAMAADAAGNQSRLATGTVTLDTISPGKPTITSPLVTNDSTPVIAGSAEAGALVTVSLDLDRNGTSDVRWTTTASGSGSYTIDLGSAPAGGSLPGGKLGDVSTTGVSVVASDLAGNLSPANSALLRVDTSMPPAPTIAGRIAGDDAINATEASASVVISGTLDAAQAGRPVTVVWGSTTRAATVSGTSWTVTVPASEIPADGEQTVRVTYVNEAGTTSVEATRAVLIDRVKPGIPSIALNATSDSGTPGDGITNDDTPLIRVTLTGTGAMAGDTVAVFSGATSVASVVVTAPDVSAGYVDVTTTSLGADGAKTLTATITDAVGNASGASAPLAITIDRSAPTVAITDDTPGNASGPVTFTFTFSEPVSGFTGSDVVVTGGTKNTFTGDSATVYRLIVTPLPDTNGQITVDVPANAAVDVAGTGNVAAQAVQPYSLGVAPTLAITDNTTGTATGPVTFTFTFSEPVNGFAASDIAISTGTKGAFTGSNGSSVYTLVVTPPAGAAGTINVSVPAGAATDLSGNASVGPVATAQAFDTAAPTLAITDNASGTASGPVTFTFTFSEPVNGFTAGDVAVTNGSKGTFTGSDGSNVYTLVVTPPADTSGNIGVTVAAGVATDLSDNASIGPVSVSQAFNTAVAPTLVITDSAPGTATGPVTFTFTFSEPVKGFTAGDIEVTNGSKGTFTGSDGSNVYTLVVTPPADTSGNIGVTVAAGVATDLSDNASIGPVSVSQAFNTAVAPTLVITDSAPGTATGPVTFTFTFSEPVKGFTAGDIEVTNGSKGTFTGSDGSNVYTLVVTPPADTSGNIGVTVAAGVATDLSDNASIGPVSVLQAFDTDVPSVTISQVLDNVAPVTGPVANGGTTDDNSPTLVLTFSELFTAGATVEIFRDATSLGFAIPNNTLTANFTDLTAPVDGTYTYTARMTDAVGHLGLSSSGFTITIDAIP